MPSNEMVNKIYGTGYQGELSENPTENEPGEPGRVIHWLRQQPSPGTFIDYGCRDGKLLVKAKELKWQTIGVEINPDVAKATEKRVGVPVVEPDSPRLSAHLADVLHLGDVIEHLTNIEEQMPHILSRIKPGGLLIAQGPLEANGNLFALAIRGSRLLRRSKVIHISPEHVILATSKGQKALFSRFGLKEIEYRLSEVAWPAPSEIPRGEEMNIRALTLYALRRLSQLATQSRPNSWGNRYFYVGQKPLTDTKFSTAL
jgi:SAM-dependent methyltransferase